MYEVKCEINGKTLTIQSGKVAKQAHGSVWVQYGGTIALVTVVSNYTTTDRDFLPLTVDYREKAYAAGRIPGGFFKREGRPTTKETLVSRLIDRPLRPRFPKGYRCETQALATVLSADRENDPDVLCILGASAALEISDIPFDGPIAAVRVGRIDGQFVANPTTEQLEISDLDIVVAGSREAVVMVEGGAKIVPENDVLDAIFFGHESLQCLLDAQVQLREAVGKTKREYKPKEPTPGLRDKIWQARDEFNSALQTQDKITRHSAIGQVRQRVIESLGEEFPDCEGEAYSLFEDMEAELLREGIIQRQGRVDKRGLKDIRNISCEVGVLPHVHGSGLFTRGETQALGAVTLGTRQDEQRIESFEGEWWKSFMLHYNFPPYSVGETRMRFGPARREIGHGNLAERALEKVIPPHEDFPYTIRIVSEILESNGSSSMASVCVGSMALMQAGIPISAQVAGIAMGLVKDGDKFFILSDILGDEDHSGDMDFKVAGTRQGVTAIQMDIKIAGVNKDILSAALGQAREGRLFILDEMDKVISRPAEEMSPLAPRIESLQIPVAKIKNVIGPGGKMIKHITETTGATIDVQDDGTILVSSENGAANAQAIEMINALTEDPEVGRFYEGTVQKVTDFGAFVEILPGRDGLVHISRLDHHRVERVEDVVREGDTVLVKCIGIDNDGKVSLSREEALGKDIDGNPIEGYEPPPPPPRSHDRRERGEPGRDRNRRGSGRRGGSAGGRGRR